MSEVKSFFEEKLPAKFKDDPSKAEGMDGVFEFNVEGDGGGTWAVAIADGALTVTEGANEEAGCKIKVQVEDWNAILSQELDATQAFMTGKLMIEGDMAMAMKLQPILGGM